MQKELEKGTLGSRETKWESDGSRAFWVKQGLTWADVLFRRDSAKSSGPGIGQIPESLTNSRAPWHLVSSSKVETQGGETHEEERAGDTCKGIPSTSPKI